MKRIVCALLAIVVMLGISTPPADAQTGVQAGIFNPSGNTLSVRARPANAIPDSLVSGVNVTIRWPTAYGITLSAAAGSFGIAKQGGVVTDATYSYQSFGAIPNATINWLAGSENELFTVTVNGAPGVGTFELTNDPTGTPWYFEIGGFERTSSTPFYTASVGNVPLPIQLSSFNAALLDHDRVSLRWVTLTETDNYGFEIQRSPAETGNYQTLPNSFVQGAGTSTSPHTYSFVDASSGGSTMYYRLKQIDRTGGVFYSEGIRPTSISAVREKLLPTEIALEQNYPNPFNPSTTIQFALPKESHVLLEVFNIIGQRVATVMNGSVAAGYHAVQFNAAALGSGIYFYQLHTGEKSLMRKMMILK